MELWQEGVRRRAGSFTGPPIFILGERIMSNQFTHSTLSVDNMVSSMFS